VWVTPGPLSIRWEKSSRSVLLPESVPAKSSGAGGGVPTRVAEALERLLTEVPQTPSVLIDQLVANGEYPNGLKADTARKALNWLLDQHRADRLEEPPLGGGRWPVYLWSLPSLRSPDLDVAPAPVAPVAEESDVQLHLVRDQDSHGDDS
jgi:hypothetical protein